MLGPAATCDVLFILPWMNAGGGERWFMTLADGLSARGHRPWAFVLKEDGGHFRPLFNHYLLSGPLEPMGMNAAEHIAKYIDLTRPKAVVFHGDDTGAYACAAAHHKPEAVVMVKHTVWDDDARLALKSHVREVVDRWVCVSDACARHLLAWGVPADKVVAVRNAVDTQALASERDVRAELGIPADVPLALHLGRISDEKGSPLVARGLVESSWWALFVGWGDRVDEVREITDGIADRVRFVAADTDVAPYYKAADLLLLPTLAEGGVPYVLMEAAACGLPTASTDVADIPALFEDRVNYIHLDRSVQGVAEVLEWGLGHKQQLQAIGRRAKAVVAEHCGLETMINKYEEVLGLTKHGGQTG